MIPYLEPGLRERFDAWLAAVRARYTPPLQLSEIRKGVRALSSLYVERRGGGRLAARAIEGAGKRAALASYYGPLHFLTLHHALRGLTPEREVTRLLDLGCGTGATGAALATGLPAPPAIAGSDLSGWALGEAAHTWAAFDLPARARRAALPGALRSARPGELVALGWVVNELDSEQRAGLLGRLAGALRGGAALLVAEPLAGRASPWWDDWVAALAPLGARTHTFRVELERPAWIETLDRAARLDHRALGARLLCAGWLER